MSNICIRIALSFLCRLGLPVWLGSFLLFVGSPVFAQAFDPSFSVGGGIQTDYTHTQPDVGKGLDDFSLDHARLYFSGDVTKDISVMFNTDYNSTTNSLQILDAVGQFHISPKFNIWFGRFLPPSDRANLYGPFYANQWSPYHDGIQDGYPFVYQGRDNGVAYWGDFKAGVAKIKVSVGAFDGPSDGRQYQPDLGRPRPDRFLGSGERLLSERHLLRRQKPAGHRRRDPGAVRQDRHNRRLS